MNGKLGGGEVKIGASKQAVGEVEKAMAEEGMGE